MSLYDELLTQKASPNDAQIIANAFLNAKNPAFVEDMNRLAFVLAISRDVTLTLPTEQPWRRIWSEMVGKTDIDAAYADALQIYEQDLRAAIQRVVSYRITSCIASKNLQKAKTKWVKSDEVEDWIRACGYSLRLNACRGIENNGIKISNTDYADIHTAMWDAVKAPRHLVEDAIISLAGHNLFHPIREYLTNLSFNGGDPIGDVAAHFTSEYNMFPFFFRKWLIGACAKAMNAEQNRMLVLDGEKGIGKSHFAMWLGSSMREYFIEEELDTHNEDIRRRLGEYWIWEVKELGSSMRKSDWESMKGFLTQRTITIRKKYDRTDTVMPALASFIGTINNDEGFMPTADRRYYIERILSIDHGYTKIDVNQVWAQAMMLYLSGENWQPVTDDERKRIEEINEDYRIVDPVEETIKKFFKIDPKEKNWWLSSVDILNVLKDSNKGNLRVGSEVDARKLARALTKLGLDKPKLRKGISGAQRGYFGIDYII